MQRWEQASAAQRDAVVAWVAQRRTDGARRKRLDELALLVALEDEPAGWFALSPEVLGDGI